MRKQNGSTPPVVYLFYFFKKVSEKEKKNQRNFGLELQLLATLKFY